MTCPMSSSSPPQPTSFDTLGWIPADSFVLHAPLELAARAALLPYVAPECTR